ncbi:hypothetical protein [Aequorivita viscosa]|uniref:Uncharacterized protein n=1 Tax=Aequorivita viscosa TaxID=797419 RepID=A0A1M6NQ38_9FLAO|nr:hypothetical protein [Aequorivita viscosa]SDX47944.1 hypothetical protein SAMN05216556_1357 [Aequorivita viscosa]SHJ97784.1 hypothetical protein SAMN04487908_1377 [Aequorivita viscosa]
MKPHIKEVLIGLLIGIIANLSGIYLYIYFFSDHSLEETLQGAIENDFIGSLIALGAILNLMAFFVFLKKKQNYRARGVLLATLIAAIVILISKF